MDKVISVLMIFVIMFAFAGCSEDPKKSNNTVSTTVGTQKTNETSTAESTLNSPTVTSEPEETIDIVATSSLYPEISNQPTMSATQETSAPVATSKPMHTRKPIPTPISYLKAGDVIAFGKYEQDNNASNGKEDIEWIVLTQRHNQVLVMSKYILDCQPYNTSYTSVTWENCTLRSWLNSTFIDNAFSSEEKSKIPTVMVEADGSVLADDFGNDTQDKVFLLGISECSFYCVGSNILQCAPTAYSESQGILVSDGFSYWWFRSVGYDSFHACYVDTVGEPGSGAAVNHLLIGVRPALWIDLSE
ncbi:MAG: hypothetical protein E7384_02865 [Ruminococcaceae bacterium]|nr:hypothetical protein [Oscillospiraceae bacterium]